MRILHVIEAVEGGTALHVRHLAGHQARRHDVTVIAPTERAWGKTDDAFAPELAAAGVAVVPVDMRRNPLHSKNWAAARALAKLIDDRRPDVVHTHSTAAGFFGRIVARRAGVPVVHTQNGATFANASGGPTAIAGRALERLAGRFSDVEIAVSESEAVLIRPLHRAARVAVVPNGIPYSTAPPRPFPDRPTVVAVGRFVFQKDPLHAVRVMAAARREMPELRALLIGYGEMEREVHELVAELDPGIEVRADIPGAAAVADATALLLCSRFEGAPYVILEAMERSRPVVATDVVGSRDAVVDGVTGHLFPHGDVARGADAVVRVARDRARALAMGAAGRERLLERFTVDAMADAVDAIYESLAARARGPR